MGGRSDTGMGVQTPANNWPARGPPLAASAQWEDRPTPPTNPTPPAGVGQAVGPVLLTHPQYRKVCRNARQPHHIHTVQQQPKSDRQKTKQNVYT